MAIYTPVAAIRKQSSVYRDALVGIGALYCCPVPFGMEQDLAVTNTISTRPPGLYSDL